jgi:hypothetical protein
MIASRCVSYGAKIAPVTVLVGTASVSVKGKLYQGGQLLGSFKARRNSMGGAFGEFRGSCSVLSSA